MTINRLHATCAQVNSINRINLQRSYVNDRESDSRLCRHFRARPSLVSDQECDKFNYILLSSLSYNLSRACIT